MRYRNILLSFFAILLFSTSSYSQTVYVTKDGYWAGITEEYFDKAIEFIVAKDYAALQKLMDAKVAFPLKPGIKVYISDSKIFSGKVKIRPVGQVFDVWTNSEAIRD